MTTNLEIIYNHLEETAGDVVWILIPRFALEVVRGRYHQHYYELPKVADDEIRDAMQALLDAGEGGMSDVLLMADFIERLDTMNGHLSTIAANVASMNEMLASDGVLYDGASGYGLTAAVVNIGSGASAWDDIEIGDLITAVEVIGAAL